VKTAESKTYNFKNPVRRDVVHAGERGEDTVIRFVTDNPGPWLFHWCVSNLLMRNCLPNAIALAVTSSSIWPSALNLSLSKYLGSRRICSGLAIVFAEDVEGIAGANPVPGKELAVRVKNNPEALFPDSWSNLCPTYEALPASMKSVTKKLPNLPIPVNVINN
jgi:iron transport multicopper oxidase